MGFIFGEESILFEMDNYIDESYIFEGYSFQPVAEFNESGVSFDVLNKDEKIASVKVMSLDGNPVDAVNDSYDYDEVYAEVELDLGGREDEYDVENVKKWVLGKLSSMGFGVNPVKIGDDEYNADDYKNDEETETDYEDEEVKGDVEEIEGDREFSIDDLEKDSEEEE